MQGVAWSYEALAKDMLDLHDPACVKAVHAFRHQQALQLEQPNHPTLEDVHIACVACYAKWFEDELAKYPVSDLVNAVARTELATRSSGWQFQTSTSNCTAKDVADGILQASGLQRSGDQSAQWLSIVASSEACSVSDLTQQLQATIATSTFVQSSACQAQLEEECTAPCHTATQQLLFPPIVGAYLPLPCAGISSL